MLYLMMHREKLPRVIEVGERWREWHMLDGSTQEVHQCYGSFSNGPVTSPSQLAILTCQCGNHGYDHKPRILSCQHKLKPNIWSMPV